MTEPSLRDRKRQRARDEIIEAAYRLFAERGYDEVTVADIAERAEVGRTTFFRYFGDKQEVVFAGEHDWLDGLAAHHRELRGDRPPGLPEALAQVRELTLALCARATLDPGRYVLRERLIADHPELDDRTARKQRRFADTMTEILREHGATPETAALAPQLALACYTAGRAVAGDDPAALAPSVAAAFDRLGLLPPAA
ncbi:TetR/AcrR family transcriptional regulator [Nonomuraea sp. NPDC003560]|uniref:TetR/AcrR family transcriptional regulator n=1 Tax=Nonomuraea sp. NPDC003560 TaxID=3364341 RepID=UPI0036A1A21E